MHLVTVWGAGRGTDPGPRKDAASLATQSI
jgi:hypothetical protein